MRLRLDATLTGGDAGVDVMQPVWDEWNAKNPDDQAADALRADRALLDRLGSVTSDEQAGFRFSLGPFDLDFDRFVGLRLNEHALHSWDIATTLDPAATIPDDAVELVVDTLGLIAGFAGKPTGADRTIVVRTTIPTRHFEITLRPDGVTFGPTDPATGAAVPDLELPAEHSSASSTAASIPTTPRPSTAPPPTSRSSDERFPASEHHARCSRQTGMHRITERLRLMPLVVEDADEMVTVLGDERMYEFTGGCPPSLEELRGRYRRLIVGHSADGSEQWLNWVVRLTAEDLAVGAMQATLATDRSSAERRVGGRRAVAGSGNRVGGRPGGRPVAPRRRCWHDHGLHPSRTSRVGSSGRTCGSCTDVRAGRRRNDVAPGEHIAVPGRDIGHNRPVRGS